MMAVFGQAAIEAAAPATGERVLDVGCGAGASSLALAARVGLGSQVLERSHSQGEMNFVDDYAAPYAGADYR